MDQSIQLFGFLVLTFLGFIVPILGILLSIYQEGVSKLVSQYNNEKSQSEKNIKEQLKKMEETDSKQIRRSLDELESIKKTAESKLSYLNPKKQIIKIFSCLIISFLCIVLVLSNLLGKLYLILLALICFSYAVFILWKLLEVIFEVQKIIDCDKNDEDSKIIQLLSSLVQKEEKNFLKNVDITVNNINVKEGMNEITLKSDKKEELIIGVMNNEARVAKNIEIGLIFPSDFIVEKGSSYSVYTDKTSQIVRYNESIVHGNTHLKWEVGRLVITSLKKGQYAIKTFIKAENIESTYRNLNLKVI